MSDIAEQEQNIPKVTLVDVLRPSVASASTDQLQYPKLAQTVAMHRQFTAARRARIEANARDPILHSKAVMELQKQQLLEQALAIQNAPQDPALAATFTKISTDIFGAPGQATTQRLVSQELRDLAVLAKTPGVNRAALTALQQVYTVRQWPTTDAADANQAKRATVLNQLQQFFWSNYKDIFDGLIAGESPDKIVGPDDMLARFTNGIAMLQKKEPGWDDWKVEHTDGGTMFVMGTAIKIGKDREPLSLSRLQGKFAHEVLVHAKRRVRAMQRQNEELANGLAGYTTAEEGLCSLVECAITGQESYEARERYLNTALALGLVTGSPVSRRELFPIVQARRTLFQPGVTTSDKAIWESVNRVYRGSAGNEVVGVFTKDIAYQVGQEQAVHYVWQELQTETIDHVMDFLLQGKFDPLNQHHVTYVKRLSQ